MEKFNIDLVPSQKGRIAIVTGANTGLGFEVALGLVKTDMKVIMACRNRDKAEKAKNDILVKVPGADIEILTVDLTNRSSIHDFAEAYLSEFSQLDLLINNAGIMIPPYSKTEIGSESQMGANYFGHFLLTGLLLDILTKTPNSRIISLSSLAHKKGIINFDDIHSDKKYSPMGSYRQSKLACLMFAFELQRRLEKKGLKTLSIASHPGVSITDIVRYIPGWLQYTLLPVFSLFTHSPEKGALPILYAALGSDVKGGDYYGPRGRSEWKGTPGKVISTPLSQNTEIAQRLWNISEELTGIKFAL